MELLAGHQQLFMAMVDRDYYPIDLVEAAFDRMVEKNESERLGNPIGYMVKLLDDWKEKGIKDSYDLDGQLAALSCK